MSAIAFAWLLFFAFTGILLNHPSWFGGSDVATTVKDLRLTVTDRLKIRSSRDPGPELVAVLRRTMDLPGEIVSADMVGDAAFIRMRGAKGSVDIQADLRGGAGKASIERTSLPGLLKELHRGEHAGEIWRALIDISGGLLIATSLIGLALYFSLKYRLRVALILIGVGLAVMVAAILTFVR
jgi:hypothetical protein